jgi:NitT/TauT family transport system substrate-binding protein
MTLQREAGQSFVELMRKKGLLEGVQEVPYLGTVTSLVADPKIAIQAYLFSEPLQAEQAGAKVRALMVSELGWNPYSSLLVTTGDMIRNQPAQVQTMVDVTLAGWRSYITNPEAGNELILKANKHGLTSDTLKYGVTKLRELAMPNDMSIDQVGVMTDERWTTLIQQMDDLDPAAAGKVKASDCYTLEFLKK